jgi:hypothetical protein
MWACVYTCVCMCRDVYIPTHICKHMSTHVYAYLDIYIPTHICRHVSTHVYACVEMYEHLQDEKKELWENHHPVRVASRLPRSDDSSGTIQTMDSRNTLFTHSASIFEVSQINWEFSIEFPSVVETNAGASTQSRPTSPSISSGITRTSPSTLAPGVPSYASCRHVSTHVYACVEM